MSDRLKRFILEIPKAELHIHLEGSLEPELMFEIARRNRLELPYRSTEEVRRAYRFRDLQSFLDIYYRGMSVLRTEEDFRDMTLAYLERAGRDNVRHAEMFFDPQAHAARGISMETVIRGIDTAREEAWRERGISTRLILCFLRNLSAEAAMATMEEALPFRESIIGVGLDSSEVDNPPERFSDVFARARAEGFRVVAHAGEEGPPEYIRQSLDILGAERIDHGVRCIEDPELVARLRREQVPLTVCPLSNVRLRVFDTMARHDLKKLLELGLRVTVNSDDPAYFGGYICDNFMAARDALGLDREEIATLARNSFQAAFLPAEERESLLNEVDLFTSGFENRIGEGEGDDKRRIRHERK